MGVISKTEDHSDYLMGRNAAEYQRLHLQGLRLEPITFRVLHQAGLKEGMNCLDVGCGTGSGMHLMGSIVGDLGSVTGIDTDKKIGVEALKRLRYLKNSNYHFQLDDITTCELDTEKYDFVFARLLLIHLTNPTEIIKKLFNAVKPGGRLLIQDYDFTTLKVSKKLSHLTDYIRPLLFEAFLKTGKDPEMGTNLAQYFIGAGIGAPDGTDASSLITSFFDAASYIKEGVKSMQPAFLKLNLTTSDRLSQFFSDLDMYIEKEKDLFGVLPMLGSAWKRKK